MHHPSPSRTRNLSPVPLLLLLVGLAALLATLLVGASCAASRSRPIVPVLPAASRLMAEAREALDEPGGEARAREAAERAAALEPEWIAPERLFDDLERGRMRGAAALAARLEALSRDPGNARLAYLAGRLEGICGEERFEGAARGAGAPAWAHHGLAWTRFRAGDASGALDRGRRAIEGARDPWERSYFAVAQARYLLAERRSGDAIELLEEILEMEDFAAHDRLEPAVWLAVAELGIDDAEQEALVERGARRAIQILETSDLSAEQCRRIVSELIGRGGAAASPQEIAAALAAREGPGRGELRSRILRDLGFSNLALRSLRARPGPGMGAGTEEPPDEDQRSDGVALRSVRMAAGEASTSIEDWLETLPIFLLDPDGLPLDPGLRRLVEAGRGGEDLAARIERGEALLAAGWFREAAGYARDLAHFDSDVALDLHARATRGRVLLDEISLLLFAVDVGARRPGVWRASPDDPLTLERIDAQGVRRGAKIDSLHALLVAMQPLFDRYHAGGGGEERCAEDLSHSPRLVYPPAASVVHPGPLFSEADEVAGRGEAGTAVGGLAAELAGIGRFGIFGQAMGGGGPDGTLRRLLWIEEVSGEHLGVPFSGSVAWCEGADLLSRPGRAGARITGAALHEGYWIDVANVHAEWIRWRWLERRVFEEFDIDPRSLLAGRGPRREWVSRESNLARATRLYATEGLDDLLRLRVLVERRDALDSPPSHDLVPFEELLEVVAIHEEGHLCDRTRFLPLRQHLLGALGLLFDAGFSPPRVAELLEYRAQLTALCAVVDPRLPLADIVEAIGGGTSVTAHAAAYRRLLADLLGVLDADRSLHPSLDSDFFLVQQLHHLEAEEVRGIARELARRVGMLEE
jgi:hypothetical protein